MFFLVTIITFIIRSPNINENDELNSLRNEKLKQNINNIEIRKRLMNQIKSQDETEPSSINFIQQQPPILSNTFNITSYYPKEIDSRNGIPIFIQTHPALQNLVFCRFGSNVIAGTLFSNSTIMCKTPFLTTGVLNLSISTDRSSWCSPVQLTVKQSGPRIYRILILSLFMLTIIIIFNLTQRKKKHDGNDEPNQLYSFNHKEKNEEDLVKRRSL